MIKIKKKLLQRLNKYKDYCLLTKYNTKDYLCMGFSRVYLSLSICMNMKRTAIYIRDMFLLFIWKFLVIFKRICFFFVRFDRNIDNFRVNIGFINYYMQCTKKNIYSFVTYS